MANIMGKVGRRFAAGTWGDRNPTPGDKTTSGEARPANPTDLYDIYPDRGSSKDFYQWMQAVVNTKQHRRADMELYDSMDTNMPEVSAALDIYADNATQVGVTRADASRGQDNIVQIVSSDDDLKEFLSDVRDRLRLDRRAWGLARDLAKNGEVYEEAVVRQDLLIDRLKQLPAKRMIRNEDEYGILDPKKSFIEVDESFSKALAVFEPWEIVHFRLQKRNEDAYGTSHLHSVRRTYKQLQMIEDSMVLARLTRANTRYVYKVDTGNVPAPHAQEMVKNYKNEHKKRHLVDPQTGQLRTDRNPFTNEEDIFIGVGQGSQAGVEQLYGDLNIGNLADVQYFQDKLLGGIKVPKSYIGVERDINSKSTLTQQDIQFARSVRRLQLAMRLGYNDLFDLALTLEADQSLKKKIENTTYSVVLPAMQTIDEMREWEVTRIQSEVARIWTQELYLDPPTVYTMLLGMPEEKAKKLFQGSDSEFINIEKNKNAAKSFKDNEDKKFNQKVREALADHETGRSADEVLADLRMLADWSVESREIEERT